MKTPLLKNNNGNPVHTNRLDYLFILIICLSTTLLILLVPHSNSLTSGDESTYLRLGKQIVEGSGYFLGFPDGRPFVPSIIALFLYPGLGIATVRLVIPIIFMNLALIATFALGKTLFGRKEGYVASLFLFTLPFFWDIGNTAMVDVPLTALTTLFLMFFYLGVEKEPRYLYISAILISMAILTKMTAILFLLPVFIYLLIAKKLSICLKKEFIISTVTIPLLLIGVYTLFHIFASADINFANIESAAGVPFRLFDILRLGLAPILVLVIFGFSKERVNIYLWLPILTLLLFWAIQGRFFDVRQFTPLFTLVGILVSLGFFNLLTRYNKKIVYVLLTLLLMISFAHSLYLNAYHQDTNWGVTTLSESLDSLEGHGKVAVDFSTTARYLPAAIDKSIIEAFEASGEYPYIRPKYEIITDEWLKENDVSYLVLSVYGELHRTGFEDWGHPKLLGIIEMPFIEIGQYGQLPPSICQFNSDFYNKCEKNYPRVSTITKDKQVVFIIYKVR